jgi:thiol:disulfide interchange protein DsbD
MMPRLDRMRLLAALFSLCSAVLVAPGAAQDFLSGAGGPVTWRTEWSASAAHPGDRLLLALVADLEEGWHIYPDATQVVNVEAFAPTPTAIRVVQKPDEVGLERVTYPKPVLVPIGFAEGEVPAYEGRAVFYLPVKVSETAGPGKIDIELEVAYGACNDQTCNPPASEKLVATLDIVAASTPVVPREPELFAGYEESAAAIGVRFDLFGAGFSIDPSSWTGFLLLLAVAMLGGLLLNFTPCVLPVIPIKIISLSQIAGNRSRCLALGTSMSIGVIAFWLALAVVISAVSGFTATNQLFQYPLFTIGLGIVIVALAIGMCGLFSVRLPNLVYGFTPRQDTVAGSFGLGIMTAILSTPCTAPFMGAAAAWAATQSVAVTLTTFAAIGVGMALPYFVLSAFPALVRAVPRSGPASQLIKEVMGLFLLAAGLYFIGAGVSGLLVTPPDPPTKLHWWFVMGMCALAGLWLSFRTIKIVRAPARRVVFGALGLLVAAGALLGAVRLTAKGPIDWVYYTPERLEQAQKEGRVVVMDFTAEWCLNCKALEHNVLHTDRVVKLLQDERVVPMKVDITGNNPSGQEQLKRAGSLTIPLLVVYATDGSEAFRSDAYRAEEVIDAIKNALKEG